ncbi:MAG: hypothetical protein IM638_13410 [Bacteroidetes bacterium]|nr:hypothetical protein [Bacteroidota bacterium]
MKHIALALLILFSFTGCQKEPKVKTITINNQYSLTIPEPLEPLSLKELEGEASMQYGNLVDEFYVVVIDEKTDEFNAAIVENGMESEISQDVTGYTDVVIDNLKKNMANTQVSMVQDTTINNMPAKIFTVSGTADKIDLFYTYSIAQGKTHYYQVITWTLRQREVRYKRAMNKLVRSLKEL